MTYEEKKKKILFNLSRQISKDSFQDLRCLYINELPYSVKIESIIQLFHYLDIGNSIGLKLLLHNLKSVNLDLITEELESFIKETESTRSKEITIGHFFRALKDGLRLSDMRKINYLLGRRDSTDFTLILCDFIFYFGRQLLNWTSLWAAVAKLDDKMFKSLILPELEKISKKWPVRDEIKYKERCLMVEISNQLSRRNIEELAFFYKMPINYMSDETSALDMIITLDKENSLSFQKFGKFLYWTGWIAFKEKLRKLEEELNKQVAENIILSQNISNPLRVLYNHSPRNLIKEIAKSQQIDENIRNFDDLLLSLIKVPEGKTIDFTPIKGFLVQIERFDLIKVIETVSGQCHAKILPEHRNLPKGEYALIHLLEKLDPITTSKLAKAYGLKNLTLNFSGELLHYMTVHGLTDIDLLKKKLTQIERTDLIECLEAPIKE